MTYKRGKVWWYKFVWRGEWIRESTKQGNVRVAREMESAHRTSLARGEVGLREKNRTTLKQFIEDRFEPWAREKFEHSESKTWKGWYEPGILTMLSYPPLHRRILSEITGEHIAEYAAHIRRRGLRGHPLQPTSANSRLRVLRRLFHLAVEWGAVDRIPKIDLLSGEQHREFVLEPIAEAKYLAAATPLLSEVATVLIDSGMRPEECFTERWENVNWEHGRHGAIRITHGKTKAARRILPLTGRVRAILEQRWTAANQPCEGWIWRAPTKSGHIGAGSLKKGHARTLRLTKLPHFVLYTFRHTFLTRLGTSGCDVWTLARIAGHSSIAMSNRYVHPSQDRVFDAMTTLFLGTGDAGGRHKIGHNQ